MGFSRSLCSKESTCQAGHTGSIPGSGRSLEKEMTSHSSILPGKSHGKRSLEGYSPWIPKSQTPLSDYRTTTVSLYISNTFYSFLCQSTFPFAVTQTVNQPNSSKNVKQTNKKNPILNGIAKLFCEIIISENQLVCSLVPLSSNL